MRCSACRGYGLVSYDEDDMGNPEVEDCRACNGTGQVAEPEEEATL